MCGIVGAVAQRNIVPVLVEGLRRLEYRGYDSCGVAVLTNGEPRRARSVARVADLDVQVREGQLEGVTGIAHTRWATHGAPVTNNAHPIFSRDTVALVHNGIIENYESLREMLRGKGYEFVSQTDTEVIAHLVHSLYRGSLFDAVREAVKQLHGAYAIAVVHKDEPHTVVGARQGSPLVVGVGEGENFLASDALALAGSTDQFIFLEEGDVCELTRAGVRISDREGTPSSAKCGPCKRTAARWNWARIGTSCRRKSSSSRARLPTRSQAHRFIRSRNCSAKRRAAAFDANRQHSDSCLRHELLLGPDGEVLARVDREDPDAGRDRERISLSRIGAESEGARCRHFAIGRDGGYVGCAQACAGAGPSAYAGGVQRRHERDGAFDAAAILDACGASRSAWRRRRHSRRSSSALFTLAVTLGKIARSRGCAEQEADYVKHLRHLPAALNSVLALEPQIIAWAEEFSRKENALFLGRGLHYPIALEGALKLKEISYIHAEAYPAGELKHGPLALVTEAMPVVTVAPNDALLEKLKSNMQEVRARGGQLYVFADADTQIVNERRHARDSDAGALRRAVADPACGAAAVAGVSHGVRARDGCGQAAESGEVGDGGVRVGASYSPLPRPSIVASLIVCRAEKAR